MNSTSSAEALSTAVRTENLRQFEKSLTFWRGLENARILMTGCSGLFGLWLLDLIDVANHELGVNIRAGVLSRDKNRFLQRYPHLQKMEGLTPIEGDVRNFVAREFDPTHLIHGATTSAAETFKGEPPWQKFDTLVSGTNHVFSQLPRGMVRSALFLSSGAVYGPPPADLAQIPETMSSAPDTGDLVAALGNAKRAAEFLCHAHAADLSIPIRVARCFSFSGAGVPTDLHYALGDFVRQALNGKEIVVNGDGKAVRSYLHLGDMAIWLIRLLGDEDRTKPNVINVGSSDGISIRELAQEISGLFKTPLQVIVKGDTDYSIGNPVRSQYVPCIKLANSYGLEPWTKLRQSLENMLQGLGQKSELIS